MTVQEWRRLIVSARGPRMATTRLVLLALAELMPEGWTRATHDDIAIATAMSRRGVILHIGIATRSRWLKQYRIRGQRGRVYQYEPLTPSCAPERFVSYETSAVAHA